MLRRIPAAQREPTSSMLLWGSAGAATNPPMHFCTRSSEEFRDLDPVRSDRWACTAPRYAVACLWPVASSFEMPLFIRSDRYCGVALSYVQIDAFNWRLWPGGRFVLIASALMFFSARTEVDGSSRRFTMWVTSLSRRAPNFVIDLDRYRSSPRSDIDDATFGLYFERRRPGRRSAGRVTSKCRTCRARTTDQLIVGSVKRPPVRNVVEFLGNWRAAGARSLDSRRPSRSLQNGTTTKLWRWWRWSIRLADGVGSLGSQTRHVTTFLYAWIPSVWVAAVSFAFAQFPISKILSDV